MLVPTNNNNPKDPGSCMTGWNSNYSGEKIAWKFCISRKDIYIDYITCCGGRKISLQRKGNLLSLDSMSIGNVYTLYVYIYHYFFQ